MAADHKKYRKKGTVKGRDREGRKEEEGGQDSPWVSVASVCWKGMRSPRAAADGGGGDDVELGRAAAHHVVLLVGGVDLRHVLAHVLRLLVGDAEARGTLCLLRGGAAAVVLLLLLGVVGQRVRGPRTVCGRSWS